MGIAHYDEARVREVDIGHIRARWTFVGEAAGSVGAGVRRLEIPPGGWSTPAHEHGGEEEIFYVLGGRGLSWQEGRTAEIATGDCIVYLAEGGAHTIHALEPLELLAFGPRHHAETLALPRLGLSIVGSRAVESVPGLIDGMWIQFVRESELGPPELPPQPGERPANIVNHHDAEPAAFGRGRVSARVRELGQAAGSKTTGLNYVVVAPGRWGTPLHCHSMEEEIFVILEGDGVLVLDEEETPVGPGHVVARPPATEVAHAFRAGDAGLAYLAYGTREPGDVCYYPRSNKISFRGVGVIARVERLDYWDGED